MTSEKAYEIIKGFPEITFVKGGVIVIPNNFKEPKDLNEALNYMFNEWDYAVLTQSDYEKVLK